MLVKGQAERWIGRESLYFPVENSFSFFPLFQISDPDHQIRLGELFQQVEAIPSVLDHIWGVGRHYGLLSFLIQHRKLRRSKKKKAFIKGFCSPSLPFPRPFLLDWWYKERNRVKLWGSHEGVVEEQMKKKKVHVICPVIILYSATLLHGGRCLNVSLEKKRKKKLFFQKRGRKTRNHHVLSIYESLKFFFFLVCFYVCFLFQLPTLVLRSIPASLPPSQPKQACS